MTWANVTTTRFAGFNLTRAHVVAGETNDFHIDGYETADPATVFIPTAYVQLSGTSRVDRASSTYTINGLHDVNPLIGIPHVDSHEAAKSVCLADLEYVCISPARRAEWIDYALFTASATIPPLAGQWVVALAGNLPLDTPVTFDTGGDIVIEPGDVLMVFSVAPIPKGVITHGVRQKVDEYANRTGRMLPLDAPVAGSVFAAKARAEKAIAAAIRE